MLETSHLIDLARDEANPAGMGAPRQVNLRRAVSTAYYAVFHALLGNVSETFVADNVPRSRALFYRAMEHGRAKDRCIKLGKNPLDQKESTFFQRPEFIPELRKFANAFVRLQELRHRSDYDPDYRLTRAQALQIVDDARQAIDDLHSSEGTQRNEFLAYLLLGLRL